MKLLQLFKSQETIIKEIHDSFDSAQDRLLAEAKAIIEKETAEPTNDKGLRLQNIGFTATPDALEYNKKVEQHKIAQQEKEQALEFAKTLITYNYQYPFLKFLTEEELDSICQKYGLIYAPVARYKKTVPDKNLKEIEQAQPLNSQDKKEESYFVKVTNFGHWGAPQDLKEILSKGFLSGQRVVDVDSSIIEAAKKYGGYKGDYMGFCFRSCLIEKIDYNGLFIAAPKSHFNLEGLEKNRLGFFEVEAFEIKDPIVFRYCKGGIQVITKWGLEANDPALINGKMN